MLFKIYKNYFILLVFLPILTSCVKSLELDASKDIKDLKIKIISKSTIPTEIAEGYDTAVVRAIRKYNQSGSTIKYSFVRDTTESANLEFRLNKMRYASGGRRFTNLLFCAGTSAIILGTGVLNYFPLPMVFISNSKLTYKAKGDSANFRIRETRQKSFLVVPHGFFATNEKQKIKHLRVFEKQMVLNFENLEYSYLLNAQKALRNEFLDRFFVGRSFMYLNVGISVQNANGTLKSKNSEFGRGFRTNMGMGYLKQFSRNLAWHLEGNIYSGQDLYIKTNLKDVNGVNYSSFQKFASLGLSVSAGGVYTPFGVKIRPYFEAAINPVVPIYKVAIYTNVSEVEAITAKVSPVLLNVVGGTGLIFSPMVNLRTTLGLRYNKAMISYFEDSDIFINSMQYFTSFVMYFGGK